VHAIPNGIDLPEGGRRQTGDGVVRFLSMGRLDAEKAVDQTIRAFAELSTDAPARLTVLGDGPCQDELEAMTRRLGQEGRVTFGGPVVDVTPYLRETEVYVSTSVSEGMSNALLEAMSYGVMPVVSRVSGADDLVEDGVSGLLFPPGDETALASRLREALSMTSARRRAAGEAARAAIRARFLFDEVAERHLALYRTLMDAETCL
jgi:glycosyltransferase involved in cell wall biosynthesis